MKIRYIHLWGIFVALFSFGLDQWSKLSILKLSENGKLPIHLSSIFDLILVWNSGISFSFLSNSGTIGRYFLIAVSITLVTLFGWWMLKSKNIIFIFAMGLIIGGALGNAYDRVIHGQVVDFLSLHYQNFGFPIFNLADCAITLGGFLYCCVLLFAKDLNE